MRNLKMVLLWVTMLLCFTTAGCTIQRENGDKPSVTPDGADDITEKIAVSATMFDNCSIKLGVRAKSIGAVVDNDVNQETQESENKQKNYLAFFDSDGNIEKVVFNRVQDGESEEITYEQIDGSLKQLYVTKNFLFLAYTCEEIYSEAVYSAYGFINNQTQQSFAIDIKTGKVYSMEQFSGFHVERDYVIKAGKTDSAESYYSMEIRNEALVITDLLPNKNMAAIDIHTDAYGNIYIVIDKGLESRNGNVFYLKEFNYYKGSDGYFYQIYLPSYNNSYGINLYHLNKDGELVESSNRSVQIFTDDFLGNRGWMDGYIFCDKFAYVIDRYNRSIDFYYTTDGYSYRDQMQYIRLPSARLEFPYGYDGGRTIIDLFYLNHHVILTAGTNLISMDCVLALDLSKVTFNRPDYDLAYASVTVPPLSLLTQASELRETAMGLIATKDTATSNTQYILSASGTGIAVKEMVSNQYDANVIFIQPLN